MTEKWTPGPWYVARDGDDLVVVRSHNPLADHPICDLGSADIGDWPTEATDRLFADARLIAAAPTLYAALEDAAKALEEAADKFHVFHCNARDDDRAAAQDKAFMAVKRNQMQAAAISARAALAKARGET